jgi:hypothetical protein
MTKIWKMKLFNFLRTTVLEKLVYILVTMNETSKFGVSASHALTSLSIKRNNV